jgi:hypothetical protein
LLPRELSGILGLIGGVIDIAVGWVFLQQKPEMGMSMMVGSAMPLGYFLLSFGAAVFLTGVYVLSVKMMKRVTVGFLMIVFGVIMLALGVGMVSNRAFHQFHAARVLNDLRNSHDISGIEYALLWL